MAKNENLRSVFDWIQIQFNTFDFLPNFTTLKNVKNLDNNAFFR